MKLAKGSRQRESEDRICAIQTWVYDPLSHSIRRRSACTADDQPAREQAEQAGRVPSAGDDLDTEEHPMNIQFLPAEVDPCMQIKVGHKGSR
jgi:hypothetical protein